MNPHTECLDSHNWGYSAVDFTRGDCTYVGDAVDKTVNAAGASGEVVAAYRVPDSEVCLDDVTGACRSSSGW